MDRAPETFASFATRCARWLGDISPTVEVMPDLPAPAPGAIICSFRGGAAMLFATGQPTLDGLDGEGLETYSEATLLIDCDRLGLIGLSELSRAWRDAGIRGLDPLSAIM